MGPDPELVHHGQEQPAQLAVRAAPLADRLTPDGRAIFGVMSGLYRQLLDEVERRDFAVFGPRIRVGKLTKARIFLGAWPAKWGW